MRAAWLSVVTVLGLGGPIGLAGCMDELPPEDPADVTLRTACTALDGVTFASIEPGECGLGPDGPVLCHWRVVFAAVDATRSAFTWNHSDVGIGGHVTCDETGAIWSDEATVIDGHFDDATLDLMWDGVAYQPAP